MPHFSVNLIALNAETGLERTLGSVKDLSDDLVIVVDSRSADKTLEIARKHTPKVFVHEFKDFASQRNFSVSHSNHDWVLTLDADEEISPELKQELYNFSRSDKVEYSACFLPRINIIFGKAIKHTNWDPDGIVRLFDKNQGSWKNPVHEEWHTTGKLGKFNGNIIHHNYRTVTEFMDKLNIYTSQEPHDGFNYLNLCLKPKCDFFRRFIWHAGFLDGWHGFFLSYLMAFYHLVSQVKAWQKNVKLFS